jgi:hypothetical protein
VALLLSNLQTTAFLVACADSTGAPVHTCMNTVRHHFRGCKVLSGMTSDAVNKVAHPEPPCRPRGPSAAAALSASAPGHSPPAAARCSSRRSGPAAPLRWPRSAAARTTRPRQHRHLPKGVGAVRKFPRKSQYQDGACLPLACQRQNIDLLATPHMASVPSNAAPHCAVSADECSSPRSTNRDEPILLPTPG